MKLLHGGRTQTDGAATPALRDLLIGDDGRIVDLLAPDAPRPDAKKVDLTGKLVTPGLIDAHQHLDKSRTLNAIPNPAGTLQGAIVAFSNYAARMTHAQVAANAEKTVAACLARGTVAIRSHVNIDPDCKLRNIEALLEVRDRWRDRIQIQVVAFLTGDSVRAPNAGEWLNTALADGADVIGGTPARATNVSAFLDLLFAAAERTGRPIDLHLDEHLDPHDLHFDAVMERTLAHGMQGKVVASHCSALSALPPGEAQRLIDGFAHAGIGVVTLPAANLFLQGRHADRLTPRGLTRVNELAKAGVTVACASDNIRDPFVPTGSGDLLEIARWTLLAAHLGSADLGRAFDMVTANPARLLNLQGDYGIRVGARADLLVTDAEDAADLVAGGSLSRAVFYGGALVAGQL